MSLEVHVDVVAAAVHLRTPSMAVSVIPDLWYEGLPLPRSSCQLPAVEDYPLHDEDGEEARRYDELRQREAGLLDSNTHKFSISRVKGEHLHL